MDKNQKRVLKEYPQAIVAKKDDGAYVVIDGEYDHSIAQEFFLPNVYTEIEAWSHAALACKTSQHFNRTHPTRMDLKSLEAKLLRIENRKRRIGHVR